MAGDGLRVLCGHGPRDDRGCKYGNEYTHATEDVKGHTAVNPANRVSRRSRDSVPGFGVFGGIAVLQREEVDGQNRLRML